MQYSMSTARGSAPNSFYASSRAPPGQRMGAHRPSMVMSGNPQSFIPQTAVHIVK